MDEEPDADEEELFFIDRDEEEMLQLEDRDLDDDGLVSVTEGFNYVHNWHLKCAIHRLETCMRNTIGKNEDLKALRKVLAYPIKVLSKLVFSASSKPSVRLRDLTS